MAARTKSKVTPKYKTKYKVKNWRAYNAGLKQRGDITVWLDEAAIDAWSQPPSGRPGGQRRYSDLAIVTALTLRTGFHLPLRQTEGFVASLIRVMGLELGTPDYTTLSRRSGTVVVPPQVYAHGGPIHLVIDSTPGRSTRHSPRPPAHPGRRQWRKESGAHQQARAEEAIWRYKRIIGGPLRARKRSGQVREALLAVQVLKRMAELGMPKSEAVVA